ncbi:TVP38/TMEM64 family protein [Hirschia litorea]|uniref:TVP38/TMEM64 family membrane protein n=1 Tax=Hirschia litorea TaxID=1199156 RepID=A0ABW2ILU4_9PROT
MTPIFSFLNRMDKSAWRAVFVTVGLFLVVAAILAFGKLVLMNGDPNEGLMADMQTWLMSLRGSAFGLPALIILFCIMAFIGAPQFGLIGLAVVAFGPFQGSAYAWVATMVSMAMTFWVGRLVGVETVRKYGGDTINRMSVFVGKNDFLASMIVRNVPTAPFIVVNMAFGVSHAKFSRFMAGAAIGILPKIALVYFFGKAATAVLKGNPWIAVAAVAGSIVIWVPLMLFARRRVSEPTESVTPTDVE